MPKRHLIDAAGCVCHVLNRAARRAQLFREPHDYRIFMRTLAGAQKRTPLRILAYCVMPNHFHLVVWPENPAQISRFMHWLTLTHSKRWHAFHGTTGHGALYQGRFKVFPVQTSGYFLNVCRYVERNPLRAGLVSAAEAWPWSSLSQRCRNGNVVQLDPWPIPTPADWSQRVNACESERELTALRGRVRMSAPYGDPTWCEALEMTES